MVGGVEDVLGRGVVEEVEDMSIGRKLDADGEQIRVDLALFSERLPDYCF